MYNIIKNLKKSSFILLSLLFSSIFIISGSHARERNSESSEISEERYRRFLISYPKCFPEKHLDGYSTFLANSKQKLATYKELYKDRHVGIMTFLGDEMTSRGEVCLKGEVVDFSLFLPKGWRIYPHCTQGVLYCHSETYPLSVEVRQTLGVAFFYKPAITILEEACSEKHHLSKEERGEIQDQIAIVQEVLQKSVVKSRIKTYKTLQNLIGDQHAAVQIDLFLAFTKEQHDNGILLRGQGQLCQRFFQDLMRYRDDLMQTTIPSIILQQDSIVPAIITIISNLQELTEQHGKYVESIPEKTVLKQSQKTIEVTIPQTKTSPEKRRKISQQHLKSTQALIDKFLLFLTQYNSLMIHLMSEFEEVPTEESLRSLAILSAMPSEMNTLSTKLKLVLGDN